MPIEMFLFARIGRMKHYAGPQEGGEKPIGAGKHNKNRVGHEAFNFLNFSGMLYGFLQVLPNLRRINPITPKGVASIDGVTVIFVAPYPDGQRVVGWYRNARVFSPHKNYPSAVQRKIDTVLKNTGRKKTTGKFRQYCVETSRHRAVLLPTRIREKCDPIPTNKKGGFGQSNISYIYEKDEILKHQPWIDRTISFVRSYSGPNLLFEPESEAPVIEEMIQEQEKAAGFQSNPAIRRAIEAHAMKKAKKELEHKGYKDFKDTSNRECYDYTCKKNGYLYFVEVKGTQTTGDSVILTKNEVNHAQKNSDKAIIVIVHSVNVDKNNPPISSGGHVIIQEKWKLNPKDLVALQYQWKVPKFD